MITTNEIAWLAGLLEGEGCFGMCGTSPRIRLAMTDSDVVEKAAKLLQSRVDKLIRGGKYKDVFLTSVFGIKAVSWMMTLYSFLCKRRKETIEKSIARWKLSRRKNPQGTGRRNPRSATERKRNENTIARYREQSKSRTYLATV